MEGMNNYREWCYGEGKAWCKYLKQRKDFKEHEFFCAINGKDLPLIMYYSNSTIRRVKQNRKCTMYKGGTYVGI